MKRHLLLILFLCLCCSHSQAQNPNGNKQETISWILKTLNSNVFIGKISSRVCEDGTTRDVFSDSVTFEFEGTNLIRHEYIHEETKDSASKLAIKQPQIERKNVMPANKFVKATQDNSGGGLSQFNGCGLTEYVTRTTTMMYQDNFAEPMKSSKVLLKAAADDNLAIQLDSALKRLRKMLMPSPVSN